MSNPTRRDFLRGTIGAGIASALPLTAAAQQPGDTVRTPQSTGSFKFVHLTDIHIEPELEAAKGFARCLDAAQSAKSAPDFIVTGGDLVFDALEVSPQRAKELFNLYKKVVADHTSLPVHPTIGNHDVFGWARKNGVTPATLEYGKAMVKDLLGLKETYYEFDHKGWRFFVLDNIQPDESGQIYRSDDGGGTWSRYGQGLPLVAVRDLYIATDGSFVRAATFGRGVWEISGSSGPAAPTLASFNPASGPVSTPVTLTGTNFTGATSVKFNGTAATFSVDSATQISTSVPSGATTGTISVTTPGGTATSASSFTVGTVTQPPTITSFTASPAAILAGDSSTLSWAVSNATGLSISGIGAVTGTSVSVSPALTTTYTLTASNALGNVTATATVTVKTRDLDGSGGSPDVLDMAVMSRAYSGSGIPTSIPAADLDGDGDVDDNDIALFLAGL